MKGLYDAKQFDALAYAIKAEPYEIQPLGNSLGMTRNEEEGKVWMYVQQYVQGSSNQPTFLLRKNSYSGALVTDNWLVQDNTYYGSTNFVLE